MRKSKKKLGGRGRSTEVVPNTRLFSLLNPEMNQVKSSNIVDLNEEAEEINDELMIKREQKKQVINAKYEAKINEINNAKYNKPQLINIIEGDKNLTLYLNLIPVRLADKIEIKNAKFDLKIFQNIVKNINPNINFKNLVSKIFKGGASLLDPDAGITEDVNREYNYFNDFINTNRDVHERIRLENLIDNIGASGNDANIIINGSNLTNLQLFIIDNIIPDKQENITINFGQRYDFTRNNIVQQGADVYYQLQYNHVGYNKNIVELFQKNFIDNYRNIQSLIARHNAYIATLSVYKKCTINDYTNPNAYRFYSIYFKSGLPNWLDIYKGTAQDPRAVRPILAEVNQFIFGDAFLRQIQAWNDIFNFSNHTSYNAIKAKIDNRLIDNRKTVHDPSDFNDLSQDAWNEILILYEHSLHEIIIGAPTSDTEIYCYRGVSRHVIENQSAISDPTVSLQCYYTSRITSFSISFDCADSFYTTYYHYPHDNVPPDACIYRTTIMRGSNMLFIESLTTCQAEYEIITPTNTVIVDPQGFDGDSSSSSALPSLVDYINDNRNLKYNNIENRFGISGKTHDIIKSIDIIIVGTPPQPPPRDGARAAARAAARALVAP